MEDNGKGKIIFTIVIVFFIFNLLPILIPLIAIFGVHLQPWHIWLVLGVTILIWSFSTYNKLIKLQQKVKQASGGIDVYLKQRFDLIPNLLETVKGYTNYEQSVLEQITKLRHDYENRNVDNIKESQELNDRYTNILALVESYPELKANESFLNLQKVLTKIESQLQAARRIYNMEVTEYNTKRLKVPSNIIASMFGFKEIALFEIAESEKANININV